MDIKQYMRKTFSVNVVEVSLENIEEAAAWCEGTVEWDTVKVMGSETKLPFIKMKSQDATASLGSLLVELNGRFRVYKASSFNASFDPKPVVDETPPGHLTQALVKTSDSYKNDDYLHAIG